jgi:threonyl-tRNA synthetase
MSTKVEHDNLAAMRHSLAHIMATAIQEIWPKAKFGVGPVIENGFYYDVDLDKTLDPDDLGRITTKMQEIIKQDFKFEKIERSLAEAIKFCESQNQPYKVELLKDLKAHGTTVAKDIDRMLLGAEGTDAKVTTVSFYKDGPFEDLCRGPHVGSTGEVGKFRLTKVSGAYWRGNDQNPQMQRVYGVAFDTQKELDDYFAMMEEAEKRDHRKLGKELDLFTFSDVVGPGLPLWTPRGTVLRNQLDKFVQELRGPGYQEVSIPHITKKDAYIKSGHWAKFADELFRINTREGHEFAMKPMNCPHHTQIYAAKPRSYRDLPIRYRETTTCYRDEQTGELSGLTRVRAFTQDDAHVFARTEHIEQEVLFIWDVIEKFYGAFGFELSVRFSRHDPDNKEAYMGGEKAWASAEAQMKKIVEAKVGKDYMDGLGEAAFYGPKIDFMGRDAIGRQTQVATIQLDFNQPEGFDLTAINEKGEAERIVMIHAAIMGSIDRFLSVYIEHAAGKFPVWLAPEQVRVASVADDFIKDAQAIADQLRAAGIRAEVDASNESVGKKIRSAELMKVPYTLVVGEKEAKSGKVSPRTRADLKEVGEHSIAKFAELVAQQSAERSA